VVGGVVGGGGVGLGVEVRGSCDDAMVRVLEWEFRDAPVNAGRERKGKRERGGGGRRR